MAEYIVTVDFGVSNPRLYAQMHELLAADRGRDWVLEPDGAMRKLPQGEWIVDDDDRSLEDLFKKIQAQADSVLPNAEVFVGGPARLVR